MVVGFSKRNIGEQVVRHGFDAIHYQCRCWGRRTSSGGRNYHKFLATVEVLVVASENGKTSVEPIADLQTKSTAGFFLFTKTLTTRIQKL